MLCGQVDAFWKEHATFVNSTHTLGDAGDDAQGWAPTIPFCCSLLKHVQTRLVFVGTRSSFLGSSDAHVIARARV